MINAIIVDDEDHCIERLSRFLTTYCVEDVRLVSSCKTVSEAIAAIQTLRPDLIFLDIQIHDQTGFDLLKQIDVNKIRIIFTTAYEQYAIKAFKFSAIDYLLKPIDKDDLLSAIDKAINQINLQGTSEKYETLFLQSSKLYRGTKKIMPPNIFRLRFCFS